MIDRAVRVATLSMGLTLGLTLSACGSADDATPSANSSGASGSPAATETHQELPRIDLAGIRDLIERAASENKVVVIDFWATWCVPCVEMFPHLHEGLKALGDRVVPVSISFDSDDNDGKYEKRAIEFLQEQHAMEHAYLTPEPSDQEAIVDGLGREWQNVAPPAVYVYGPDGELAAEFVGAPDPEATAEAIVDEARSLLHGEVEAASGTASASHGEATDG